jgi:hypothetical protein
MELYGDENWIKPSRIRKIEGGFGSVTGGFPSNSHSISIIGDEDNPIKPPSIFLLKSLWQHDGEFSF